MTNKTYLISNLKLIRRSRKLTQAGFASKIGVRQCAISRAEKGGDGSVSVETVVAMSVALQVPLEILINHDMSGSNYRKLVNGVAY